MNAIAIKGEVSVVSKYSPLYLERMPSYITRFDPDLSEINTLRDIYQTRESIVWKLSTGNVLIYRETNLAVHFEELALKVEEDCMFVSSPSQIALHTSYQAIIGIGKRAIPLLIKKLDRTSTMWFLALQAVTGANPVKRQNKGNVPMMVIDWKNWYKKNFYGRESGFRY